MPDAVKVAQARNTIRAQRPGAVAEERAVNIADGNTWLGPSGATGTATPVAYAGVAGPAGAAGTAGLTGPTGPTGSAGPTGPQKP